MTPAQVGEGLHQESDELVSAAKEVARRRIAENEFALADDVRRDLERIFNSGRKAVEALPD